jgi:hypothetical protein
MALKALARFGIESWVGMLHAAAADRHVVKTKAAGAAALHHGHHAVAAGLNHLAAHGVATGAGDADAVFHDFRFAHAHGHVEAAHHHAIVHHAAAHHGAGHHFAEVLKHADGHGVVAHAHHFHAAVAFFHLHGAAGDHHHIHGRHHHALICGHHWGGHRHAIHRHHCFHHNWFFLQLIVLIGVQAEHGAYGSMQLVCGAPFVKVAPALAAPISRSNRLNSDSSNFA